MTANMHDDKRAKNGPTPHMLNHLTVLDLTQHLSGPYATQILGDLGARIIKVEPPAGDATRTIGPYFQDGLSAYFLSVNRNKESVCIDLKTDEGKAILLELVSQVDIVVENFRPGTLDRLGLNHETLTAANPTLILCSISGFGQDGPYRDQPAFDIVVQALSGAMSLTGEIDGDPVRSGLPIGDICAGMYGVIAVLAALPRAAQGLPTFIDVSMLDTQIAMLSYVAAYYLIGGSVSGPQGSGHMSIPTYRSWACAANRRVVTAAMTERQWQAMTKALGQESLTHDARFTTNDLRREHKAELYQILEPIVAALTEDEFIAAMVAAQVPVAPINSVDRALSHPQVQHRHDVIDISREGRESCHVVGSPMRIEEQSDAKTPPPYLGEHTFDVLTELTTIDRHTLMGFVDSGIVGSAAASTSRTSA